MSVTSYVLELNLKSLSNVQCCHGNRKPISITALENSVDIINYT